MDFWRAVEILAKRKWLILLSVVVATTLTYGATRLVGSKWVAAVGFFSATDSTILPNAPDPLKTSDRGPDMLVADQQAGAYSQLVREAAVLEPALKELNLNGNDLQIQEVLQNLKFVATSPRSFELQVTDSNPERAGNLANSIATSFQTQYARLFTTNAKIVVRLLKEQLAQADKELRTARLQYESYLNRVGIVSQPDENLRMVMDRLRSARQKRDDAAERAAQSQARMAVAERDLRSLPLTVAREKPLERPQLVIELEQELARAETALTRLEGRYTAEHPEVKQAREYRDNFAKRLQQENSKLPKTLSQEPNPARQPLEQGVRELRQDINGNQASLASLDSDIAKLEAQLSRFQGVPGNIAALSADVAQRSEERQNVASRLRAAEADLVATSGRIPLSITNPVGTMNVPLNSTEGRTKKLILLAALCALVGSAGLIIAFDSVDRRLRNVHDAELALPSRVLAAIPQPLGPVTAAGLSRAAEQFPLSLHAEAYRFLAVNLLGAREQGVRSVMLASAKADQGSTSTLTNLAITLAQAGQRVIVVDGNLRTPQVHQVFGMSNTTGFSTLLRRPDAATMELALQPTSVPNLRVITSGPDNGNPWELFRSENLREVARRLEDLADYVLYDTPSALAFTDALNLAPAVDAALLCVRALEPTSGAEQRLVEMLEQANVTVLGSVLSDVPASVLDSYVNYQRYYPSQQSGTEGAPALPATSAAPAVNGYTHGTVANGVAANGTAKPDSSAWIDMPSAGAPSGKSENRAPGIELDI